MAILIDSINDFGNRVEERLRTHSGLGNLIYLHYHSSIPPFPNAGTFVNQAQIIVGRQKTLFAQRFNASQKVYGSGTQYTFKQIKGLINRIGTSTNIGSQIVPDLENNIKVETAADIKLNVGGTEMSIAEISSALRNKGKLVGLDTQALSNRIEQGVETILRSLEANSQYELAEAVLAGYAGGEISYLPPEYGTIGKAVLSTGELAKAKSTLEAYSAEIKKGLSIMSQHSVGGELTLGYQEGLAKVVSSFNAIGGLLGEMAVLLAAGAGTIKIEDALQTLNKNLTNIVAANGGKVIPHWTAQNTDIEGHQGKEDVRLEWRGHKNGGQLNLVFGASVKVRHGKAFKANKGRPVTGFVAVNSTMYSLLQELERYIGGITLQAQAAIASLAEKTNTTNWWYMLRLLSVLTLVDALAGQGAIGNGGYDFASLLIVNNKIYSVANIIEEAFNANDLMVKNMHHGFTVDAPSLGGLRDDNTAQSQSESTVFKKAYERNMYAYTILQRTKVKITLNLGYMFNNVI